MATSPPQQQFAQAVIDLFKLVNGIQLTDGAEVGVIVGDELPPMQDLSVLPPQPDIGRGDGSVVLVAIPMADGSQVDLRISYHPPLSST